MTINVIEHDKYINAKKNQKHQVGTFKIYIKQKFRAL